MRAIGLTWQHPCCDRRGEKISTFLNREILALETGIIRQMYVINRSALDPVEPQAVIEAVAR